MSIHIMDPARTPALAKEVVAMTGGRCTLVGTRLVIGRFSAIIERVEDRQRVELPVILSEPYREQLQAKLLVFA